MVVSRTGTWTEIPSSYELMMQFGSLLSCCILNWTPKKKKKGNTRVLIWWRYQIRLLSDFQFSWWSYCFKKKIMTLLAVFCFFSPAIEMVLAKLQVKTVRRSSSGSVHVAVHELLLDGVLAARQFAVRHVETKVGPLVSGCRHPRSPDNAWPVGNGDGVTDAKVHSLHDTLTLQLPAWSPDGRHGRGGHVAAGANELLAVVIVVMRGGRQLQGAALFQVLQSSPDGESGLLGYLHGS